MLPRIFKTINPRFDCQLFPLAITQFLVSYGFKSRYLPPDKFEYSHQLFSKKMYGYYWEKLHFYRFRELKVQEMGNQLYKGYFQTVFSMFIWAV